jgi:hypothetical protein
MQWRGAARERHRRWRDGKLDRYEFPRANVDTTPRLETFCAGRPAYDGNGDTVV